MLNYTAHTPQEREIPRLFTSVRSRTMTTLPDAEEWPSLRSDRTDAIQKGRASFDRLSFVPRDASGITGIQRATIVFGAYELSICNFQRESLQGDPLYDVGVIQNDRLVRVLWHLRADPDNWYVVSDLTKDEVSEIISMFSSYAPKNKETCWQLPNQRIKQRN